MRKSSRVLSLSGSSRMSFLPRRLFGRARFERRPEIAGGHAVKPMRLLAEALAQSARRQRQQAADGFDAELEKRIAKLGLDVQTIERHGAAPRCFSSAASRKIVIPSFALATA